MSLLTLLLACQTTPVKVGDSDLGTVDSVPVEEGPSFVLNPMVVEFGTIFVGQTEEQTVDVLNNGTLELNLGLTIVSDHADAWGTTALDTAMLLPGEHTSLNLRLQPTLWGNFAATVAVVDSATSTREEVVISALVQQDLDGDGVGSIPSGGTDCDDSDPTAFPGAPEVWYDGVDEDCLEGDDYDQDGDGYKSGQFGGDDCLDTDAAVYPGAQDFWYDGIDSDCAGNSDYDLDHDGHDSDAYGGDDCDDHDVARYPGVPEVWYDGVDSDCAGDDDYDQDHDGAQSGAYGGADCNDLDAAIAPGVPEIWYDGVDQDCAGDDDYDQDKDKVDSSLYGGTDCNDTDPTVTGPTTEVWDGQDNDCNGYADDFSVSALSGGVLYGTTANQYLGVEGTISLGGDLTGDGVDDLVVGTPYTGFGMAWVVSGGSFKGANGKVSSYDAAEFTNDNQYYTAGWVQGPQADADGDGVADLLITASSSSYGYGISYWFTSTVSGSLKTASATASYTGDSSQDYTRVGASADIDGDGLAEIITGNAWDAYVTGSANVTSAGLVAVFNGYSGSYDIGDAADYINGQYNYDYLGYSLSAQDLDSDGYADLLVGAPGRDAVSRDEGAVYVIPGNASLLWNGDQINDSASLEIDGSNRSGQLGLDPLYHQGDLDGDGSNDLVVSSKTVGEVWLWWGLPTGTASVTSADATFSGAAGSYATAVAITDFDGDGAADLVIGDPSSDLGSKDAGALWFYSSHSRWKGAVSTSDALLKGAATGDALGSGLAGGVDVEKDGWEDLAAGASGADGGASGGGAVYFLSGR